MFFRRSLFFFCCLLFGFSKVVQAKVVQADSIKLLAHQEKVISYLKQNPEIHGLLLYHALGSGKTITALAYAQQQSLPTIIVVPEVLKAHWLREMEKVGVKSGSFELLSYSNEEDLAKLVKLDPTKALVIVDEIQKFIEYVRRSPDTRYLDLYWSLMKSKKLLALSGTPVYNDAADVAYIGNLVIGKETFPFHPDAFKAKYMRIDTSTSLFRGYLTESKWMVATLPLYGVMLGASLVVVSGSGLTLPLFAMAGSTGLNYVNEAFPIKKVSFREFDAALFADFTSKYISYYQAREEDKAEYPEAVITPKRVHYSESQVKYFLNFIDGNLDKGELESLLKDYPHSYSDAMRYLNSSKIQQDILSRPEAGREIGNMTLTGSAGQKEIAPKFLEIEKIIRQNLGKTAVYSSYYHNGIELFAEFLRERKYAFEILNPKAGVEEITRVLSDFNTGKNKILLIHPDVTEGISLIEVEQFHILEPVKNEALEKQIIGRSVRYRSHLALPKERQKVAVYLWDSTIKYTDFGFWPTDAGLLRNDHWRKNYREVNPNLWTNGITQLDAQYFKKDETPDARVIRDKDNLTSDMLSFEHVSAQHSIESEKNYENSLSLSSELSSPYAIPLLTFNKTFYRPYYLHNVNNGEKAMEVLGRTGYDFAVEIPHNNHLNFGFGLRASTSTSRFDIGALKEDVGSFELDLGFFNRLHYDLGSNRTKVALFWKNELDTSVFALLPAYGLGLGVRESIGIQYFFTKHLGLDIAVGVEAKVLKDTLLTQSERLESEENVLVKQFFERISAMRSFQPYVSVGLFSSYF